MSSQFIVEAFSREEKINHNIKEDDRMKGQSFMAKCLVAILMPVDFDLKKPLTKLAKEDVNNVKVLDHLWSALN